MGILKRTSYHSQDKFLYILYTQLHLHKIYKLMGKLYKCQYHNPKSSLMGFPQHKLQKNLYILKYKSYYKYYFIILIHMGTSIHKSYSSNYLISTDNQAYRNYQRSYQFVDLKTNFNSSKLNMQCQAEQNILHKEKYIILIYFIFNPSILNNIEPKIQQDQIVLLEIEFTHFLMLHN